MTVYQDFDYLTAMKQKRKVILFYWSFFLLYLIVCVVLTIQFHFLPYQDAHQVFYRWGISILSVLFVFFSFPYLAIKYRRVKAYCKMLNGISNGIKDVAEGEVVGFLANQVKDGVDADLCVIKAWNERKKDFEERQFYIDREKPIPGFKEGDQIRIITQANMLVQYQIIKTKGEQICEQL